MYEVELKAVLNNLEKTITAIESFEILFKENITYHSIYFDSENILSDNHRELRIRTIIDSNSEIVNTILTYKDTPFDDLSRSKPELEIEISDMKKGITILNKLGYKRKIGFEKKCVNYKIKYGGFILLVTIAFVPDLNQSFIEVECPTEKLNDVEQRFEVIRDFLKKIGINETDLTIEYYTDAIVKKRTNE